MKPCPKCGNESPQPQVDHMMTRGPGVYHIYCPSCGEGVRANWRDDAEQKWDAMPRRDDQPAPMYKWGDDVIGIEKYKRRAITAFKAVGPMFAQWLTDLCNDALSTDGTVSGRVDCSLDKFYSDPQYVNHGRTLLPAEIHFIKPITMMTPHLGRIEIRVIAKIIPGKTTPPTQENDNARKSKSRKHGNAALQMPQGSVGFENQEG